MKIGQKEKIMLLLLVIILIGGCGYNYILKPLQGQVKALEATNTDLKTKLTDFQGQFTNSITIDKKLVKIKVDAISLSKELISVKYVEAVSLEIDSILKQFIVEDSLSFGEEIDEIPYVFKDESGLMTEDPEKKIQIVEFNLIYRCSSPDALNKMLIGFENDYPFIIVENYSIPELKETIDPVNKYSGSIVGIILVVVGQLDIYDKDVFQCPHTVDGPNGTLVLCGEWNAYNAKLCSKCKKALDYCPNADCHTLLTGNESQCPVCDNELIECNSCHKKALYSDTVCSKCGKSVSGT